MRKKRDQRNGLIVILLVFIVVLFVGFAVFVKAFINEDIKPTDNFNVSIIDVKITDKQGDAENKKIKYEGLTSVLSSKLDSLDDRIEYTITLKNNNTFDVKLEKIKPVIIGNNNVILYNIDAPLIGSVLKSDAIVTAKVTAYVTSTISNFNDSENIKELSLSFEYSPIEQE